MQNDSNRIQSFASILILAVIGLASMVLFWQLATPRKDFYNELWAPAHLLVQGKSPYDTSSLNPELPAAWFPMAIGLFFPFGWLSESVALYTWFVLTILLICFLVFFLTKQNHTMGVTAVAALLCFFFPSTINHLRLGQVSLLVAVSLILAIHFADSNKWLTAFFVALALSKPHLALLGVLGLSLYYFSNENLKGMLSFWLRTAVMSLALCLPLFIAYPNWIPDAIHSMTQNPVWTYPSLFIFFQRQFGTLGYLFWGITSLIVLWICFRLWKNLPYGHAMVWSLAIAPLLTPYIGSWDFVVILPLLVYTFARSDWKRRVVLLIIYAITLAGMIYAQTRSDTYDYLFWWVPPWMTLAIGIITPSVRESLTGKFSSR